MHSKNYFIYILTNKTNKVFYTGITCDLSRRLEEHSNKIVKGFASKYHCYKLIYYEVFNDIYEAIEREKQLKRWHREWKINLIKQSNPQLDDISANLM